MVESRPFRCGRPRAWLRPTVRGRLSRLMPESVLISLGETPLRRCARRKSFPSGRVGDAFDFAAGYSLNLLNQLAVVEHAVDRLLYEFEDQGLLRFTHVVPPCFRPAFYVRQIHGEVNSICHTETEARSSGDWT